MNQKIINIMETLKNEFKIHYQQQGDNKFEVQTAIYEAGHRTFFQFELSSDTIRCETVHIVGYINTEKGISNDDLLNLLRENYFGRFGDQAHILALK